MGVGLDDFLAEGAELVADLFERVFEASMLDGGFLALEEAADVLGGGHAGCGGVAFRDQRQDSGRTEFLDDGGVGRHVARTDNFKLRHRQAAAELVEVFAEQDLGQELFDFAELALGRDAVSPVGRLL